MVRVSASQALVVAATQKVEDKSGFATGSSDVGRPGVPGHGNDQLFFAG